MKYTSVKNELSQELLLDCNGFQNDHFPMKICYFHLKTMNSKMESLSKLERWIMNIFSLRSNLNFKKRLAIELELQIGKL